MKHFGTLLLVALTCAPVLANAAPRDSTDISSIPPYKPVGTPQNVQPGPPRPMDLQAVSLEPGTARVSWPEGLTEERIVIRIAESRAALGKSTLGVEVPQSPNHVRLVGLKPGATYFFQVSTASGMPIGDNLSAVISDRLGGGTASRYEDAARNSVPGSSAPPGRPPIPGPRPPGVVGAVITPR